MFGLAFTNPFLWFGALTLCIPVIVHLFTRRTPVNLVFPTLRFLRQAKARQSRIFRVRHLLLLLLRTALLALILLAFLRPVYRAGALAEHVGEESKRAAIVILDTSLSMGYARAGVSPLSAGKAAASKIVDYLDAGDAANLILVGAQAVASLDAPSTNFYRLRKDIEDATSGLGRADIDGAVALAVKQLSGIEGAQQEIHFVSDFQRTNWASVNFAAIPEDVKTVFVFSGDATANNTAITEIRVNPAHPTRSEDIEVTCRVSNHGDTPKQIPLDLHLEGFPVQKRTVEVAAGMTATATFRLQLEERGVFEGYARIPDDGLSADNTRYFTVPVGERLRIMLLTDESAVSAKTSRRFLEMALDPFAERAGPVAVEVLVPDDFDGRAAARSDIVIVAGASAMSKGTGSRLVEFVRDGGGLIYFLTGVADQGNLSLLSGQAGDDFSFPFTVGAWMGDAAGDQSVYAVLEQANYDAPLLKKFRDSGALAKVVFFEHFATRREAAQGNILLQYDNKHIALAEKSLGLGTLLLANFSPHPASSDLAKNTVFVPLVHEMVRAVRPHTDVAQRFQVGAPCSTTVPLDSASPNLRFTAPDGTAIGATLDLGRSEGGILFGVTSQTGFYRVFEGDRRIGSVAVNIDRRESNLGLLTRAQLEEHSVLSRNRFYAQSDAEALRRVREGTPLWYYLLLMGMGVLLVEQLCAFLWKH